MKKTAIMAAVLLGVTLGGLGYLEFAAVKPTLPAKAQHKTTHIVLTTKDSGPVELEEVPGQSIVIKAVKSRVDRIAASMEITDKRFRKNDAKIFAALGLTDAEIEAVVNELNTREVMIDMVMGQLSAKYSFRVDVTLSDKESATIVANSGDAAIWNRTQAQITQPMEQELQSILGDKYPVFHYYEQLQPYQMVVDDFNSTLPDGSKLSEEQSQTLLTAINSDHPNGWPNTALEYITPEVMNAASSYLSSDQFSALTAFYNHDNIEATAINNKLASLLQSGWKGNTTTESLLIPDPFQ